MTAQFDDGTDREIRLNETFGRFKEHPRDDFIDVNRLTEVLQAFGRSPSLKDSQDRIDALQRAGKFELKVEDFLQVLDESWTKVHDDREGLRRALEKFDLNNEGFIHVDYFRTAMSTFGEPLSSDELDALMALVLNDGQSKIDIDYLVDQLMD